MRRIAARALAAAAVAAVTSTSVSAQAPPSFSVEAAPVVAVPQVAASDDAAAGNVAGRFVRDLAGDYKHFFSVETGVWLGVGGAAALAVHPADESIRDAAIDANTTLPGGAVYGSQYFQMPAALAVWAIASAAGSERLAQTGRDLLRGQILVSSWTFAIKLAAQRTRPNGDPYSFPSGHATASFTTAAVLQDHYGWKAGVPAFIVAAYTGASRVTGNYHWTSDVVFGAALGVASGRTVTIKFRKSRVTIVPAPVLGGAGVLVNVVSGG